MTKRTVDQALSALHAFMAEENNLWPDDERAIEAAIGVLQKYRQSQRPR